MDPSNNHPPSREPPPPPPPPPKQDPQVFDASDLTHQFENLLRTRRLNNLSTRSRSPSASRRSSHSERPTSSRSSSHQRPSSRHSSHAPRPQPTEAPPVPTTYTSLRNHPIIATPPQDAASLQFRNKLVTISHTPLKYENPGLLDDALKYIPLDRIYGEAEDERQLLEAQAASLGGRAKAEWGYQDCVIRALLK